MVATRSSGRGENYRAIRQKKKKHKGANTNDGIKKKKRKEKSETKLQPRASMQTIPKFPCSRAGPCARLKSHAALLTLYRRRCISLEADSEHVPDTCHCCQHLCSAVLASRHGSSRAGVGILFRIPRRARRVVLSARTRAETASSFARHGAN